MENYPSPPNQSKPAHSNNVEGGDTLRGGDTFQNFAPNSGIDSNFDVDRPINQNNCSGGDTFEGGDKGGDKKRLSPPFKSAHSKLFKI